MLSSNGMLSRTSLGCEWTPACINCRCRARAACQLYVRPWTVIYHASRNAHAVGCKYTGKVRDVYETDDGHLVLVTTDRQSAFDRLLACVPFKGQVLNLTSLWWFERTKHIVPNHVVASPHPNVTIARKCTPFRIEFVVRAYLTGTTSTSIWMHYKNGSRMYCGHSLPDGTCSSAHRDHAVSSCDASLLESCVKDPPPLSCPPGPASILCPPRPTPGMVKNQPLPTILVTPTTKEELHDRPISAAEIVSEGWMSASDWAAASDAAANLFRFGQAEAAKRGLILVDTKYELGKDAEGRLTLIDEVHTPDSSRYWIADSYDARLAASQEPENIDKEFLRIWFRDHCDPYADLHLPEAPRDLIAELSRRYVFLYERITGCTFNYPTAASASFPSTTAISAALAPLFPRSPRRLVTMYDRDGTAAEEARKLMAAVAEGSGDGGVAREFYPVSVAHAPLPILQLCRDIATEAVSNACATIVAVVCVGGRSDDVSRLVAAQAKLPTILLLPAIASATSDPGADAISSLRSSASAGVLVAVDAEGAALSIRRMFAL